MQGELLAGSRMFKSVHLWMRTTTDGKYMKFYFIHSSRKELNM